MIFETIHSVTSDTKISQYQSQTIYGETIHLYLFLKLKAYWLLLLIYIIFKHCIQDVFLYFFFVWFFCGVIFIESNLVEQVPGEPHTVCEGATCPRKTLHRAPSPIFKHIFEHLYFIYLTHVEHLKYILPYTEKSSQTSKMYWLEFLPRDAATYHAVSKKMIYPRVTWVCLVYPEVLRDTATA